MAHDQHVTDRPLFLQCLFAPLARWRARRAARRAAEDAADLALIEERRRARGGQLVPWEDIQRKHNL